MSTALRLAMFPRVGEQLINPLNLSKFEKRMIKIFLLSFVVIVNSRILGVEAYAAAFTSISEILDTGAFTGNTKWLEKLDFLAKFTQGFISIVGIVGIMLNALQIIFTIMVLTNKRFWEKVDQVHQSSGDGFKQMFGAMGDAWSSKGTSLFSSAKTKGIDLVFELLYGFLPNLLQLSDLAEGEYKGALDYLLKSGPRHIMVFVTYSMMIVGTLFDSYIVIVDGFGAATNRIASVDSAAWVDNIFDSKTSYKFTLGNNGTAWEKYQGSLAKKIYAEIVKDAGSSVSDGDKFELASAIETYVAREITKDVLVSKVAGANGVEPSDIDWDRVSLNVVHNTIDTTGSGYKIPSSVFGTKYDNAKYLHVYMSYKPKNTDGTFYFSPQE